VQALADAGLYRMFLPRSLGGGEVHPLTYFDVVEELARADSAVGWSVLISTSSMTGTARALGDPVLRPLFTSPRRTIMGGSAPPRGRAVPVSGGYRVTGRWTQGSNVRIARARAGFTWVAISGMAISSGWAPRAAPSTFSARSIRPTPR
jgi:indole-3-acetate monooxygenase